MNRADVTVDVLKKVIQFDPKSGVMIWRQRGPELFNVTSQCALMHAKAWNTKFAGKKVKPAFDGRYMTFSIFGMAFYVHRAVFAFHHGRWPEKHIDHINGDKRDNRIENLREVERSDNAKNLPLPKSNSSGFVGVTKHKKTGKWKAQIGVNGKSIYLGLFETLLEARQARKSAEKEYGFHSNHGRAI